MMHKTCDLERVNRDWVEYVHYGRFSLRIPQADFASNFTADNYSIWIVVFQLFLFVMDGLEESIFQRNVPGKYSGWDKEDRTDVVRSNNDGDSAEEQSEQ